MNILHVFQDDGVSSAVWGMRVIQHLQNGKRVLIINEDAHDGRVIGYGHCLSEQEDWRLNTYSNCETYKFKVQGGVTELIQKLKMEVDIICWNIDIVIALENFSEQEREVFYSLTTQCQHMFVTQKDCHTLRLEQTHQQIYRRLQISTVESSVSPPLKAHLLDLYQRLITPEGTSQNVTPMPFQRTSKVTEEPHQYNEWAIITASSSCFVPRKFFEI